MDDLRPVSGHDSRRLGRLSVGEGRHQPRDAEERGHRRAGGAAPAHQRAGILGLAIGFGSQNLVKDIVTGFFIIMEGQYAVGDSVEINGLFGRVEQVGLRITKIRDANGQLRFISNGSISRANNYTANYIAHTVNVPFPHEEPEDPAAAVQPILDDFEREFQVFVEAPAVGPVESLPSYARVLKLETRSIPGRQSILESKLPARLKAGLERAGHALPSGTEISVALRYPAPGVGD
jgi:small conductance mechanosensitive channel